MLKNININICEQTAPASAFFFNIIFCNIISTTYVDMTTSKKYSKNKAEASVVCPETYYNYLHSHVNYLHYVIIIISSRANNTC